MFTPARFLLRLSLALVIAMTSACSAVRIAYDNSDRMLVRYADGYLDLNDEQKALLRTGLRQRLADHRRHELRALVAYLDAISDAVRDTLSAAEVSQLMECGQGLYETTIVKTLPVLTPVLARLEPRQIDYLSDRMDENNREYRQEYLAGSREERLAARARRVVGAVEFWTGDLRPGQRQLVYHLSQSWPDVIGDWYAYRLDRQRKLLGLLRKPATTDELDDFLTDWWTGRDAGDPDLERKTRQLVQDVQAMIVVIDQSLTPKQRQQVLKRIRKLRDDLASLLPVEAPQTARVEFINGTTDDDLPPARACAG